MAAFGENYLFPSLIPRGGGVGVVSPGKGGRLIAIHGGGWLRLGRAASSSFERPVEKMTFFVARPGWR